MVSFDFMSTVAEIESAIEKLPESEQDKIRAWLMSKPKVDKPILHKLAELAGTVKNLPSDFALNHDHYLHGTPKREE
jgi:hypothetical protein